jgi:hypothetical protein
MAQINRAVITTKAMEIIAKHLQGLPGRKKLIWISSSFAAQTTDVRSHNGQPTIEHKEFGDEINHAVHTLNDANVAVYPIDPKPVSAFDDTAFLRPGIDAMNLFAGGLSTSSTTLPKPSRRQWRIPKSPTRSAFIPAISSSTAAIIHSRLKSCAKAWIFAIARATTRPT